MKRSDLLLTTLVATLLAAPVAAQQADFATTGGAATTRDFGSFMIGDLLGRSVTDRDGSEVGQIEAVVESETGPHALVGLANLTVGLADRTVALPLGSFSMADDGQSVTIDRSVEEIDRMSEYEPSGERTLEMNALVADAMNGSALETAADDGESPMAGTTQPATDTSMADAGRPGLTPGLSDYSDMTVGDVLGMTVVGADGDTVGEIDRIYRDGGDAYMAVIGIGGFLGIGENTVALPLRDFSVDRERNALVLDDRTEDDLEAMEEIDENRIDALPEDHVIGA